MGSHPLKENKIDSYTFGGTEASKILASILNTKYPKYITKVSSYYHKFNTQLTSLVQPIHNQVYLHTHTNPKYQLNNNLEILHILSY